MILSEKPKASSDTLHPFVAESNNEEMRNIENAVTRSSPEPKVVRQ